MLWAVVVVPVKVWVNTPVPELMVRFWLAPTVKVPFEVNPEVAVIKPEMVGVAVQEVGPTVNPEPLMVVAAPARPRVNPVWVAVPMFKATPVAVSKVGDRTEVTAFRLPSVLIVEAADR